MTNICFWNLFSYWRMPSGFLFSNQLHLGIYFFSSSDNNFFGYVWVVGSCLSDLSGSKNYGSLIYVAVLSSCNFSHCYLKIFFLGGLNSYWLVIHWQEIEIVLHLFLHFLFIFVLFSYLHYCSTVFELRVEFFYGEKCHIWGI